MEADLIKRRFGLGTLIFLTATCGCELSGGGVSPPEDTAPRAALRLPAESVVAPRLPADLTPDPAALQALVEERLSLDRRFHDRGLAVRVKDGTVLIEGSVSSEGDRAILRRVVADVPHVRSIDDRGVIESPLVPPRAAAPSSDPALQRDLQRALNLSRRVVGTDISVRVEWRVAVLSGIVGSDSERIAAGEIALNVPGVWSVKNGLVVQPR